MRGIFVLALAGLLVVACGDDGSDSLAAGGSTSTEAVGGSSTTTTTVPEGVDEYRTAEMEERLEGTHVYLGGWTITSEFDRAVEQWGRGAAADPVDWYATGGEMEVWVGELLRRTADGIPVWQRTDMFVISLEPEDDRSFSARCRIDEQPTDGILGLYRAGDDAAMWAPAVQAWRVDVTTGIVAAIEPAGVECENEGFGI